MQIRGGVSAMISSRVRAGSPVSVQFAPMGPVPGHCSWKRPEVDADRQTDECRNVPFYSGPIFRGPRLSTHDFTALRPLSPLLLLLFAPLITALVPAGELSLSRRADYSGPDPDWFREAPQPPVFRPRRRRPRVSSGSRRTSGPDRGPPRGSRCGTHLDGIRAARQGCRHSRAPDRLQSIVDDITRTVLRMLFFFLCRDDLNICFSATVIPVVVTCLMIWTIITLLCGCMCIIVWNFVIRPLEIYENTISCLHTK